MARETTKTTKTIRTIYKCKSCKSNRAFDYLQEVTRTTYTLPGLGLRTDVKKSRPVRTDSSGRTVESLEDVNCPSCGNRTVCNDVIGIKSAHECDKRCMTSTGSSCECSCGGANHGAAYL